MTASSEAAGRYPADRKIDSPVTRRQYYLIGLLSEGYDWSVAMESIASTAIEHPEWDLDERKTLAEWEEQESKGAT